MEIGGLRYPRELHVDTKEERLKNIVVFCTDFSPILSSVRLTIDWLERAAKAKKND